MPRDIEDLLEEWRQGDGPRIVQAGALKRVADEFDRLRAIEYAAREWAAARPEDTEKANALLDVLDGAEAVLDGR